MCTTEPLTPSDAVAADGGRPGGPASGALSRTLRGDLDNIVLKAIQKEPELRYASAEQFAADLQRYRSREPVMARPPTPGYRARRFVARNRGAVAAALVVLLSADRGSGWNVLAGEGRQGGARTGRAPRRRPPSG